MKTIKQRISYAVMGLMAMGFTACTQKRGRRRDEARCGSLYEETEKRGRRAGEQCVCRGIKRN